MKILCLLAFLLLSAAVLSLFRVAPSDLTKDFAGFRRFLRPDRKVSLKQQIRKSVKKKQIRGIRKILSESRGVLKLTHRTDRLRWYTAESVLLFFAGALISFLLGNYYLLPVLAVGMSLLPWLAVLLSSAAVQKQLNEELGTALSTITTSYLRSDNIIDAVRENVGGIHYPIREIFDKFLIQADLISSDITSLLEEMRDSLDNAVFRDWADQVILCRQNRTLKSTLQPIVSRLSSVREISGKLDNLMYNRIKEFIEMVLVVFLSFPMIRLTFPDGYRCLTHQAGGQILIAGVFAILFLSLCANATAARPAEYGR